MAIDSRYQDNIVLKKDAFQNLLTNIKNYPIIDIDYITDEDVDELHGDNIWKNYTNGMPCIKISYGDERSIKGNVIFAEEQRKKMYSYQKILNQLTGYLNDSKRQLNRLKKVYEENNKIWIQKDDQIQRYLLRWQEIENNKLAFLKAGWNLLYCNLQDLFDNTNSTNQKNTLYPNLGPENFEYIHVLLPENGAENTEITRNIEYIVLNANQQASIINRLVLLRDQKITETIKRDGFSEGESFFTAEEQKSIQAFIDFVQSYNYLALQDAIYLANYRYTSDQILIEKDNKIQINNDYTVARFILVENDAPYNNSETYYTPKYETFYIPVGRNSYQSTTQYYKLIDSEGNGQFKYQEYIPTDNDDFEQNRILLYTQSTELICYSELDRTQLTANNRAYFNELKNNNKLYIKDKNSQEITPSAISKILADTDIRGDFNWSTDNNSIILDFNALFTDFNTHIQNVVNTLNDVVEPRMEIIVNKINDLITLINSTIFTFSDGQTYTVNANDETIYSIVPAEISNDKIAAHLLDEKTALDLKVKIINKIIDDNNKLIEAIAKGEKDKNGNEITDGENRILYGYKYVKVGSNIGFDNNYDGAIERQGDNIANDQSSGSFIVSLNGTNYEVPIKGFGKESNQDINILTTFDSTTGEGNNINFKGNLCGAGNIITNNGNIYASSGAVAASTYLALRGFPVVNSTSEPTSLYSPSNTAGFWYDGANHIISTWNITDDVGITDGNKKGITLFSETGKFTNLISNTGNFTNLYINGKDLSKLGDSSDTAHFWRGDNEWSDTLTGTLHISKDTVNWLDSNSQAAIVIDKKSYNSWISGFTNNGTISITTWPANTSSVSSDMLYFGYIENGHDPKNLYFDKAMTWNGRTGDLTATKVHNAVFNDYAECRATIDLAPGYVVIDKDDGTLECSSKRLQPGAQVISDTFGHLMGETDTAKTPIAVAGRVLVYTYQPRENYHAGMAVCSAPNGTVDIMTREEIRNYPDCIIGIVSEIPQYEEWGTDNIKVDGRIWIKVK